MYFSDQDWRVGNRCFPDGDDGDDDDDETNPREDHQLHALSIRISSNQAIKQSSNQMGNIPSRANQADGPGLC